MFRKKTKKPFDWSKVFKIGQALRLVMMAIVAVLFAPLMVVHKLLRGRPDVARQARQGAVDQGDRISDMEADIERKLSERKEERLKRFSAPAQPLPSTAIASTLRNVAAGRPLDADLLVALDPTWQAWLDGLTKEQAEECLKVPASAILRHLKGKIVLPGIPPRRSQTQDGELFQAMKAVEQRHRFGSQQTADDLVEVVHGRK